MLQLLFPPRFILVILCLHLLELSLELLLLPFAFFLLLLLHFHVYFRCKLVANGLAHLRLVSYRRLVLEWRWSGSLCWLGPSTDDLSNRSILVIWRYLCRRLSVLIWTSLFSDLTEAIPYSSLLLFVRFYCLLLVALYSHSLEILMGVHLKAVADIEFSAVGSELT